MAKFEKFMQESQAKFAEEDKKLAEENKKLTAERNKINEDAQKLRYDLHILLCSWWSCVFLLIYGTLL